MLSIAKKTPQLMTFSFRRNADTIIYFTNVCCSENRASPGHMLFTYGAAFKLPFWCFADLFQSALCRRDEKRENHVGHQMRVPSLP